jgi:hypothetical protein
MIPRIRQLAHQMPFIPFTIRTTDGRSIVVPTSDHIAFSGKFYVIVTQDGGKFDILPALHLAGVTTSQAPAN